MKNDLSFQQNSLDKKVKYSVKNAKIAWIENKSLKSMLVSPLQFLRAVSPYQYIFELHSRFNLDHEILLIGQIYSEFQTELTGEPVGQDFLHFSSGLAVQQQYTIATVLMKK